MKKLLAIALVLVLVFGMGTIAFATVTEPPVYEDESTVTIKKDLTVTGGINPAETFNFTVGGGVVLDGSAESAPAFDPATFSIDVAQGVDEGTTTIDLPDFLKVGTYKYPITETAGSTAGFDYDSETYYLVVTVINNPDFGEEGAPKFLRVLTLTDENDVKDDSFDNSFDAGSLKIKKVVEGNYGDPDDTFTVTVTLTPKTGKVLKADQIDYPGSTSFNQDSTSGVVTITYTVKKGSEYTIKNIPYDVDYFVAETGFDGYTPKYEVAYDNEAGEINAAVIETTITNKRNLFPDTGINLDSLPYIIILAVAIGGLILFVTRKRMAANE